MATSNNTPANQQAQQQPTSNAQAIAQQPTRNVKQLFDMPQVIERFGKIFAGKADLATSFMTNVLTVVNNSEMLRKADPNTVLTAALLAASIKLPITPGLGMAAIVPFFNGKTKTQEAQFQIMTRGYIQLAQRSGQVTRVTTNAVREGEVTINRFTDDIEYHKPTSERIVGYLAFVRLQNGFEKFVYMTIEELQEHAKKYSQTAAKGYGLWVTNFDAMAKKTVLKLLLSKWCPLATDDDIIKASQGDGAVIREGEGGALNPDYVDNPNTYEQYADVIEEQPTTTEEQAKAEVNEVAEAMKRSVSEVKTK